MKTSFLEFAGDIDVIRQSMASLQEDVRQKQKDLDMLLMQQTQVLDNLGFLREGLMNVQRCTSHLNDILDDTTRDCSYDDNNAMTYSTAASTAAKVSSPVFPNAASGGIDYSSTSGGGGGSNGSPPLPPPPPYPVSTAGLSPSSSTTVDGGMRKRAMALTTPSFLGPVTECIQEDES